MMFIELQNPGLSAEKMSMANSFEVRVPFLNRDLMDFALRVPDACKLRYGISKEPIKRLAAQYVSRGDIYRPKTGFGVPIQQWFMGKLGDSLMDLLGTSSGGVDQLFDRNTIDHHLTKGWRTVNEAFQLWMSYNMLVWKLGIDNT